MDCLIFMGPWSIFDVYVFLFRNNPSHDFVAYFVCRNPIGFLLSSYSHWEDHFNIGQIKVFRNGGIIPIKLNKEKFYSWPAYLDMIASGLVDLGIQNL